MGLAGGSRFISIWGCVLVIVKADISLSLSALLLLLVSLESNSLLDSEVALAK